MRCAAIFFLGILLKSVPADAQSESAEYYGPYSFEPGTTRTIFSDTALVRSVPGGETKDTLYAFAALRVTRRMPALLTVGRKTAPWYEVAYAGRNGYVWGGAFALGGAERDGVQFLFNVLSYPQRAGLRGEDEPMGAGHNTCAIKAQPKGSPVQQSLYNISRESASFLDTGHDEDGKIYYPRFSKAAGLPAGAKFLVHFYMSGEACGIPSYDIAAAWDGARLISMPMLESNADAGVWSYDEEYVYPGAKGGKPGYLTVRGTSEEYEDGESEKPKLLKRTLTAAQYRWDAPTRAFVKVPEKQ